MTRLIVQTGRPGPGTVERLLEAASAADLTYGFAGATLDPGVSSPLPVHHRETVVGHGQAAFDAAADGIRSWAQHRGVRATVHPVGEAPRLGGTVLVALPAGPITVLAPCRVVRLIEEDRRVGFAYGTLPGHPESGEEAFLVEHLADDSVRYTVRVSAEPATPVLRALAPLVAVGQRIAVGRYLAAMRAHVGRGTAADRRP